MKKQRLFTLLAAIILLVGPIGVISGPSVAVAAPSQQSSLADLSVTKTDSPDPLIFGNPLSYTLTVTNHGPSDATGVTLTDTLPSGVTFGSATASQGDCSGTVTVTCDLGDVADSTTATVTIAVTPTVTGTVSNTASVVGNESDSNMANNSDTITSTVNPIVYAVIPVDTENGDSSWFPNDPNPLFDTHNYKHSATSASIIFSESFRNAYVDSFGGVFKMSWFAEMDQAFEAATYLDESPEFPELTGTPVGYTGVMDTLLRYWGDEVQQFGDGIYWHHHVMMWTGSAWEWNDAVINRSYTHHFDALNEMLIDRSYFPSIYRAGWLWEDSNINTFLNDWVPFDYSADSGNWAPYHPNTSNPWSSAPPNLDRWMTRCDNGVVQSNTNAAFTYAQTNGAAVYCAYFHDSDYLPGAVDVMHSALTTAAANYPGVQFQYVTALDGIQNILGFTDRTPPVLGITRLDASTYQITSDEPVWQDTPYVAARNASADGEHYEHVSVTPAGINTWQASIPPHPTVQYRPVAVTASGEYEDGWATNAIDDDPNTWWVYQVPAWIQLELAEIETITNMDIHFYDGDSRQYTYGVEASTNGTNWTQIVPAGTVVQGLATHEFDPPVGLRYVRITVTDNTMNDWAHIREIRLYGIEEELFLQTVGVGASDVYGNPGVALYQAVPIVMEISPAEETVMAGEVVTYTATVQDEHGITQDATADTVFTITPAAGGSWADNVYTSQVAGDWTVTGEYADLSDTATLQVEPTADLSVTKINSADPVRVGSILTYTVTVTNNGPSMAMGVTVTDTLPSSGVTFGSATPSQGDCSGTSTVVCTLGNLGNGATATVTIIVTPTTAGMIINSAEAMGTDPLGNLVSNTDAAEVTVISPAIEVVEEASVTTASVSETITYTCTVENTGDVPLINVHASDDRLGAISLDSTTLAPSEITTGTTTYLVDESDLPGPLTNTVTVTGTPPVGAEVSHTDTVTVHVKPILSSNTVYLPIIMVN